MRSPGSTPPLSRDGWYRSGTVAGVGSGAVTAVAASVAMEGWAGGWDPRGNTQKDTCKIAALAPSFPAPEMKKHLRICYDVHSRLMSGFAYKYSTYTVHDI